LPGTTKRMAMKTSSAQNVMLIFALAVCAFAAFALHVNLTGLF
jgi:hypothetical protein